MRYKKIFYFTNFKTQVKINSWFNEENMPVASKRFLDESEAEESNPNETRKKDRSALPKQPLYNNMIGDISKIEATHNRHAST